jgi:hypothetical protein
MLFSLRRSGSGSLGPLLASASLIACSGGAATAGGFGGSGDNSGNDAGIAGTVATGQAQPAINVPTSDASSAGPSSSAAGSLPTGGANNLTQNPTIIPYVPGSTASSRCLPGHYKGSFQGMYSFAIAGYANKHPVSGAIVLDLLQSSNPEFLSISNGTLSGTADYIYPFTSTLTGTLDCTTNKFTSKMNGSYKVGIQNYPYTGTLASGYDPSSESLTPGTWNAVEPNQSLNGGSGSWNATYSGP